MRQPRVRDNDLVVRLEPADDPARLPVPKDHVALPVTRGEKAAVGRKLGLAGVSGDRVARESLLALWEGRRQRGFKESAREGQRTFCLNESAPKMRIWLSSDCIASHFSGTNEPDG